ncbi:unnamed protein product, partial [Hymenolepis diminuta]|uniref:EXS domain-containing protein n=1 Tax=Hymenolepis diminuta TaxID=6216 RepID=A0A0R3SLW5_HYMDI
PPTFPCTPTAYHRRSHRPCTRHRRRVVAIAIVFFSRFVVDATLYFRSRFGCCYPLRMSLRWSMLLMTAMMIMRTRSWCLVGEYGGGGATVVAFDACEKSNLHTLPLPLFFLRIKMEQYRFRSDQMYSATHPPPSPPPPTPTHPSSPFLTLSPSASLSPL